MTETPWTAPKAANKLTQIVKAYCAVHGGDRFPVDVERLAKEAAFIFGWEDPIAEVRAANIAGFEGSLSPNDDKSKWLLLYNNALPSPGRIRFTQAHELGHYILHRLTSSGELRCSEDDMLEWDEKNIEAQADQFASYLLMPLDDYRAQLPSKVDLDAFDHCSDRYGVSLTAAILKWLEYTDDNAVLVRSSDGFINWAKPSARALKAGAFIRTRNKVVAVPPGSLAANEDVRHERQGAEILANVWFRHAAPDMTLREMKVTSEKYGSIWSLLCLPRMADVWEPRAEPAQ